MDFYSRCHLIFKERVTPSSGCSLFRAERQATGRRVRSEPRTALQRSARNWLRREGGSLSIYLLKNTFPRPPRDLFSSRPRANGDGPKMRARNKARAAVVFAESLANRARECSQNKLRACALAAC